MEVMLVLIVGAFVAEILGTVIGFGSSTLFLPFALFFLDFPQALLITAFLHIFGNLARIAWFRKKVQVQLFLWFGIPSMVCAILGAFLVGFLSPPAFRVIVGIFLVLFVFFSWRKPKISLPTTRGTSILGGSISGFVAGIIGTGGALRSAFMTAFKLPKEDYIATMALIALAVDMTRIPVYIAQGFGEGSWYSLLPFLLITAVGGSYLGRRIVRYVPQSIFHRIVLIALLLAGIDLVVEGVRTLLS